MRRRLTHGPRWVRAHARSAARFSRADRTGSGAELGPAAERVVDAERVEHGDGDELVPGRRQVQAVHVPHPRVVQRAHPPEVDQRRVVPVGDLPDQLVVDGEPAAERGEQPGRAGPAGVVGGEEHQPGAGRGELLDAVGVDRDQRVDVDPRPEDVVHAGVDGDQVGRQRDGGLDLLGDDLAELAAADGEVGVGEVVRAARRGPRRPGRPSRGRRSVGCRRDRRRPR